MRRIAFVNEKGDTCKTTLCVNTAAWIATQRGMRVLVADLDTQGHAGKALGVDVRGISPTIRDVLLGESLSVTDVARPTGVPGLDLLPANKDLAGFPVEVAAFHDRADRLQGAGEEVSGRPLLRKQGTGSVSRHPGQEYLDICGMHLLQS